MNHICSKEQVLILKNHTMIRTFILSLLVIGSVHLIGQSVAVEGYAYESGNRGYLYGVEVSAYDAEGNFVTKALSDSDGFFQFEVPMEGDYDVKLAKAYFEPMEAVVNAKGPKVFLKYEMKREPGYFFEVTLAEARTDENQVVDQIKGALIEVYNNTTKESVMVLEDHQDHEFKLHMSKGNHYTILVRKEGYLAKRMEAFVNVEGCILCFEGVGSVKPGVTENLTEGNANGVLLANVEMDSLFRGKKLAINDLYYDLGKWDIKPQAAEELDKVITMLTDNPHLSIELGSHTDSRGSADSNMSLSSKRAQSAASYLRSRGIISSKRISYKGYGETEINNGCTDGVDCDEAQHARNRRTELTIVGIDDDSAIMKTLTQMKTEEHMDAILADLSNEGVIKVVGGDTTKLAAPAVIEESIIEKAVVEKKIIKEPLTDKTPIVDVPVATVPVENVPVKKELAEKVKEQVIEKASTPIANATDVAKKVKIISSDSNLDTKMEEEEPIYIDDTGLDARGGRDLPQQAAVIQTDGFTGYRIAIKESTTALSADDKLWTKHPGLNVYFDGSKFVYSLGTFNDKPTCEGVHRAGIKIEYPDSYVAEFKNGTLIEK